MWNKLFGFGSKQDVDNKTVNNKQRLLDSQQGILYSNDFNLKQYLNIEFNYDIEDYFKLIQSSKLTFYFIYNNAVSDLATILGTFSINPDAEKTYTLQENIINIKTYSYNGSEVNIQFDFTNKVITYDKTNYPFDLESIIVNNEQDYFEEFVASEFKNVYIFITSNNNLYEYISSKVTKYTVLLNYSSFSNDLLYFKSINNKWYCIQGEKVLLKPVPDHSVDYQEFRSFYKIFKGNFLIENTNYNVYYYNNDNSNTVFSNSIYFKYSKYYDLYDYSYSTQFYQLHYDGVYYNIYSTNTIFKLSIESSTQKVKINDSYYMVGNNYVYMDDNFDIKVNDVTISRDSIDIQYNGRTQEGIYFKNDNNNEFFFSCFGTDYKVFIPVGFYDNTVISSFNGDIFNYFIGSYPKYVSSYYKSVLEQNGYNNITSIVKEPYSINEFYDIINFIYKSKGKLLLCYGNGFNSKMTYLFFAYTKSPYLFDIVTITPDGMKEVTYGIKSFKNKIFNTYNSDNSNCFILAWNDKDSSDTEPLLTFALDVNRKLYKFRKSIDLSEIKDLIDNYDNPFEPNNN